MFDSPFILCHFHQYLFILAGQGVVCSPVWSLLLTKGHYIMLRKVLFTVLAFFSLSVPDFNAAMAENAPPACIQLEEKSRGDMAKYSVYGEANGPVFFSGITCAIEHRN